MQCVPILPSSPSSQEIVAERSVPRPKLPSKLLLEFFCLATETGRATEVTWGFKINSDPNEFYEQGKEWVLTVSPLKHSGRLSETWLRDTEGRAWAHRVIALQPGCQAGPPCGHCSVTLCTSGELVQTSVSTSTEHAPVSCIKCSTTVFV